MQAPEKKCPFCAEFIKSEAVKCKHCGSDLAASADDRRPVPKATKTDVAIFLLIASVPFVLGGLMLIWYNSLPAAERARFEQTMH